MIVVLGTDGINFGHAGVLDSSRCMVRSVGKGRRRGRRIGRCRWGVRLGCPGGIREVADLSTVEQGEAVA